MREESISTIGYLRFDALMLANSSNSFARSFKSASVYCDWELCLVKMRSEEVKGLGLDGGLGDEAADKPTYWARRDVGGDAETRELTLRRRASKARSSSSWSTGSIQPEYRTGVGFLRADRRAAQ